MKPFKYVWLGTSQRLPICERARREREEIRKRTKEKFGFDVPPWPPEDLADCVPNNKLARRIEAFATDVPFRW